MTAAPPLALAPGEAWRNWSGSLAFAPAWQAAPADETAAAALVAQAAKRKIPVRAVGAGHSSSGLAETKGLSISLGQLTGLASADAATGTAVMRAGTTIKAAGEALIGYGLSFHNMGDIDLQHLAGAFATGTHGSGLHLQNLPGMLRACRLIDGQGVLRAFNRQDHPEIMQALQVSLGACGIMTEMTVSVEEAHIHQRLEFCADFDAFDGAWLSLADANRIFDFYWYPQTDRIKMRLCNRRGEGGMPAGLGRLEKSREGWLHEVLPKNRTMKFEEMEYALPREAAYDCFLELRRRIRRLHPDVWWRVLFRTVAADDAWLSPFYGRPSATIAILQHNELEYQKYFADIEPVLRAYGGRPHWGKKHNLEADALSDIYPHFNDFISLRQKLDPEGLFLNGYLRRLLGL